MPLPFEVITCPGATALEEINRIATSGRGYPVLLGGAEDYERVIENAEESEEDADEIAKRALAIDTDSWLQERFESDPEYYEELSGEWPEDVENSGRFIGHTDISSGEPLDQVHIAVLPIRRLLARAMPAEIRWLERVPVCRRARGHVQTLAGKIRRAGCHCDRRHH